MTLLFVFKTQIFDCLDSFGVICSLSWVRFCLAHSKQASSCFRTVASRSQWQCKTYLVLLSGPHVCKCLRSTQQLVEIRGIYRDLEVVEG